MVFYWEILPPRESFQNMCLETSLVAQWLRHWVFTSGSAGLIPGQGPKISHAAQNGQKTKTENPRNQCLSWHFTQTTEAFLLPTENSLLHSSEFLGYYRMVPACFMTSQTILFFLPKCRLQTQVSHVHSLNRQWLSFRVWVSLHPHLPPEYSQVWSVIVISHSSRTLRAFVLEKVKVLIAWFFVTPWTVAHQVPLSMGFSRQEYWMCCHSFSRGSSWPRDRTWVSCIASRFLPYEPPWEVVS